MTFFRTIDELSDGEILEEIVSRMRGHKTKPPTTFKQWKLEALASHNKAVEDSRAHKFNGKPGRRNLELTDEEQDQIRGGYDGCEDGRDRCVGCGIDLIPAALYCVGCSESGAGVIS